MAVKLRLMRMGKKKQPTYRVVAADIPSPRDGRFIEILGQYEPRAEPSVVKIDSAKAGSNGCQRARSRPETVQKLLQISGAWAEFQASAGPNASTKASTSRAAATRALAK